MLLIYRWRIGTTWPIYMPALEARAIDSADISLNRFEFGCNIQLGIYRVELRND